MKKKLKKLIKREKEEPKEPENVPRVTTDTLSAHREKVLSDARKYKLPLSHSKRRIVMVSVVLSAVFIVGFFVSVSLALYRFDNTSGFIYRVTQVIPFPVARQGSSFISYEKYLFELRHTMHYYQAQEGLDFSSEEGQALLADEKKKALEKVINDAYIKMLAGENNITVTEEEVDQQIELQRQQNRLGNSEEVLEGVLRDFWGWTINDFRRSLKTQLLERKVVSHLDEQTHQHAQTVLGSLSGGTDFAAVAKEHSDDLATKDDGGEFGFPIERTNRDIPAQTVNALYGLSKGEISDIINTGFSLEIVRFKEEDDNGRLGAHIVFNFEDANTFINDLKEQRPMVRYISP